MQMQKLTGKQKSIRRFRQQRNRMVGKMLAENHGMLSQTALRRVTAILHKRRKEKRRK